MVTEFANLEIEETLLGYELIFDFKDKSSMNIAEADATMAIVMQMCRVNLNEKLCPLKVSLSHLKPNCEKAYFSYYNCPVEFSQPINKIILPTDIIDVPLFNSEPYLSLLNDKAIIHYLNELDNNDIVHKIRKSITEHLSSGISSEIISNSLNMGERTMIRALKKQGFLFKDLVKEVRFDLGKLYIKNSHYSLTEIAFQLGFSESSSFSRAFKNWAGCSPADYRKNLNFKSSPIL